MKTATFSTLIRPTHAGSISWLAPTTSSTLCQKAATKTQLAEPVVVERTFSAPTTRVWKALTDVEEMRRWYFDLKEFKPEVGFEFEFTVEHEGVKYCHLCKSTEVIPQKKLAYTWRYKGHEGDSLVAFELFADGDKTRLKLTHEGLETFPKTA